MAASAIALATLSLSGSSGIAGAMSPGDAHRALNFGGSALSEAQLMRVSAGLSPYSRSLAERVGRGEQGWTPTGSEGWGIYDLSQPHLLRQALSYDEARAFNALIRPADIPILPANPLAIETGTENFARALECMTQAVYYEAGFESHEGQQAVAQVVLNRVLHPAYPDTVCSVVYQGSQRVTGCQFSFTCDGSLNRAPNPAAWQRSRAVAEAALRGAVFAGVGTSTHYHADYVLPYWAVTLVKLKQIGAHIFYRMTGPNGAPDAFTSVYAGNEAVIDAKVLFGGDARTPDAPTVIDVASAAETELTPEPRTVTLTTGGVSRTYIVGNAVALNAAATAAAPLPPAVALDLGAAGKASAPTGEATPVMGTILPSRRQPTPEEIREVNERLRQFQLQQYGGSMLQGVPIG